MAKKSCKKGYYYCYASKKCKKIPMGYYVGGGGWLRKEEEKSEDTEGKKKNGNGANGDGSGNGDSSGGSNGGGVSEGWSAKYKRSIDCNNPKGFSQRAHCQGRKKVNEATMSPAQKRKETMLKKKYDESDMKQNMIDQYGKEEGTKIYFATIRKQAMKEEKKGDHEISMAKGQVRSSIRNLKKIEKVLSTMSDKDNLPAWLQAKITDTEHNTDAAAGYMDDGEEDLDEAKKCWKGYKKAGTQKLFGKTYNRCVKAGYEAEGEQLDEKRDGKSAKDKGYSLRDWFKGGGWVQAGGKYDGKPCAKQPGQKTKPFCRDADDRASMSKKERNRRAAKKRKEDPNPNRKGKAKMVSASYSNWRAELEQLDEVAPLVVAAGVGALAATPYLAKKFLKPKADKALQRGRNELHLKGNPIGAGARGLDKQSYEPEGELVDEGKKDACYYKVKSRYKVWPSAYASGALVKCRKKGADNWGNNTKKEGFSNWREDMLLEGLEDKLRKMSPEQIEDLIKNNKGAEKKIRETLARMRSATPRPQGSGPQMPQDFAKQGVSSKPRTTVNVGDYASRNVQGSAWQRAQQNPSAYRPGPGVRPDFSGVNPRPRTVRPKIRFRGGGKYGLLKALAGPALVAGASALATHLGLQHNKGHSQRKFREGYEFSNWRDDFQAMEIETFDIIKAEPLRASDWRTELNIIEDWQKSNRKDGVDGMSQKSVNAYKRENPGSKLQTAVTEKKPKGKRAKRRKSFCARSKGQKDMHNIDCSKTPEKKICKARKRWRC